MGKPSPQPQPDHELVVLRDYIEGDPILDLTSACKSFADRLRELGNELAAAKLKAAVDRANYEISYELRRAVKWSAKG